MVPPEVGLLSAAAPPKGGLLLAAPPPEVGLLPAAALVGALLADPTADDRDQLVTHTVQTQCTDKSQALWYR